MEPKEETTVAPGTADLQNPESVRAAMIKDFSVGDGMTAGLLEKTSDWRIEDGKILCRIDGGFTFAQLKSRLQKIEGYLEKLFGRPTSFVAEALEAKQNANENLPVEVEILRDIFKGQVI